MGAYRKADTISRSDTLVRGEVTLSTIEECIAEYGSSVVKAPGTGVTVDVADPTCPYRRLMARRDTPRGQLVGQGGRTLKTHSKTFRPALLWRVYMSERDPW